MTAVRVLVADDNEDHRFLTIRALRDLPGVELEIETAADGEEALQAVRAQRPDLVLLDLKMPKVDGLGVLREIKGTPELRSIPTVVLTSSDRPEDVQATYDLGGNSFVTKPSTAAGLREGLRMLGEYWTGLSRLP